MKANNSVIAVFDSHNQAEEAVRTLERTGFDMRQLSIVGKGFHEEEHPVGFYTTGDRAKSWGTAGAFWGGIWGLLLGAAFFWIPGIGPLAMAGPLVNGLVGGLGGAALVGGLSALGAALVNLGLTREKVIRYETQLKADRYLLIAHGSPEEVLRAHGIIESIGPRESEIINQEQPGQQAEPQPQAAA
jgi:hypothetical protein